MLFEITKALDALKRPGVQTNFIQLAKNAVPYYFPFFKLQPPLTIYWSINSVCNLHCKM